MIGRRGFITGLVSFVAAPAIVRVASLMPIKAMVVPAYGTGPMMHALPIIRHFGPEYIGIYSPSGEPCLWAPTSAWLEHHGRFDHLSEYLAS